MVFCAVGWRSFLVITLASLAGQGSVIAEVSPSANAAVRQYMAGSSVFIENAGQWAGLQPPLPPCYSWLRRESRGHLWYTMCVTI